MSSAHHGRSRWRASSIIFGMQDISLVQPMSDCRVCAEPPKAIMYGAETVSDTVIVGRSASEPARVSPVCGRGRWWGMSDMGGGPRRAGRRRGRKGRAWRVVRQSPGMAMPELSERVPGLSGEVGGFSRRSTVWLSHGWPGRSMHPCVPGGVGTTASYRRMACGCRAIREGFARGIIASMWMATTNTGRRWDSMKPATPTRETC